MMHFHCEMQASQKYKEESKNHPRVFLGAVVINMLVNHFSDIFLLMDIPSHPWLYGVDSFIWFFNLPFSTPYFGCKCPLISTLQQAPLLL